MASALGERERAAPKQASRHFAARLEPFDSYWQGTRDLRTAYDSFAAYYRHNYLPRIPADRTARIAVLSCGPGYLVDALVNAGYQNVVGVDADPEKVKHGLDRSLPCIVDSAFQFLEDRPGEFDIIIPEQELNHLSIAETIEFLGLCATALRPSGRILVYAINGANPLVASEHIAHNIDHLYNVTERSITQLLALGGFTDIKPFACKLYVFWNRPANYLGLAITELTEFMLRVLLRLYGEKVVILSKRIGATATRAS